jgi:LemA protein
MAYDPHPGPASARGIEPRQNGLLRALVLAVILIVPCAAALLLHNQLVARHEAVDAAWAQVESNYQRRADLVPRLVEAVKRHMRHEAETLKAVVHARGEAFGGLTEALDDLAAARSASERELARLGGQAPGATAGLGALAATQERVGHGIRHVLALAEAYPTLRSADHFLELQAQLEGSENRINVTRMEFNEAVRSYNAAIEQMPARYLAEAKGYTRRAYFLADEGAERAAPLELD